MSLSKNGMARKYSRSLSSHKFMTSVSVPLALAEEVEVEVVCTCCIRNNGKKDKKGGQAVHKDQEDPSEKEDNQKENDGEADDRSGKAVACVPQSILLSDEATQDSRRKDCRVTWVSNTSD